MLFFSLLHRRLVVAQADVDGDELNVGAMLLERLLQARHLLPARNAPGCPELDVDGPPAVALAEIDRLAIDGLHDRERRRLTDDSGRGLLREILAGRRVGRIFCGIA